LRCSTPCRKGSAHRPTMALCSRFAIEAMSSTPDFTPGLAVGRHRFRPPTMRIARPAGLVDDDETLERDIRKSSTAERIPRPSAYSCAGRRGQRQQAPNPAEMAACTRWSEFRVGPRALRISFGFEKLPRNNVILRQYGQQHKIAGDDLICGLNGCERCGRGGLV
jgi:hypothetical protein